MATLAERFDAIIDDLEKLKLDCVEINHLADKTEDNYRWEVGVLEDKIAKLEERLNGNGS